MTALLFVALLLPLAGAAAAALVPGRPSLPSLGAGVTALCWAALAGLDEPVELGRLVADPLPAAALAGTAAVLAGRTPRGTLARSAGLCALTVLAVGACWAPDGATQRPLALAVVVLSAAAALGSEPSGWPARVLSPPVAGLAVGVGLLAGEGAEAVVAAAAAALVLTAVLWRTTSGFLLLPATLLATHRAAEAVHVGPDRSDWPPVAVAAAAGVVLVALAAGWTARRDGGYAASWAPSDRAALAVVAAAVVLVTQDLAPWRSAGLLLAAGAVLALAASHAAALVAAVPGLAAAVQVSSLGSEPVHGVAAGAVVAVVAAGVLDRSTDLRAGIPSSPVPRALLMAALLFAVVPLWGWSGATPDGYVAAVATAAAGAGAVAVGVVVAGLLGTVARPAGFAVPTGSGRGLGRLQRRSNAVNHASTYPPAEEAGLVEEAGPVQEDEPRRVGAEVPVSPGEGGAARPPQPPVASPARIVPRRAGGGGVGGRGRLRARPGRPPR